MPATRLLVVADSKMLTSLASGLREGGKFEVATASLADPAAAQGSAAGAEAVALFYGGPPVVQALAAKVRDRGGRVVAVLQRDQLAQRDECFRAGASDLLFMPMGKEQFVARLEQACTLSFQAAGGAPAEVAIATRTATAKVPGARVMAGGIEASAEVPLKAGDTVRLSWDKFQTWGLVARASGPMQIRFAGLTLDEEAQIRKWLDGAAAAPAIQIPVAAPAASAAAVAIATPATAALVPAAAITTPPAMAPATPPSTPAITTPPPPAAAAAIVTPAASAPAADAPVDAPASLAIPVAPDAAADAPLITPPSSALVPDGDAARAAPAAGPPPGFADRKSVRGQRPPATRGPPPVMTPPSTPVVAARAASAPADAPIQTSAEVVPAAPAEPAPSAPPANGAPTLGNLFDEPGAPDAAPPPAPGPPWPTVHSQQASKSAALFLLQDKPVPSDAPSALAASARKITGMLGSAEREALQKAGSDSHFAEALAARIALDAATTEGVRLYSSKPAPSVDAPAVAALTGQADDAAERLQKEANSAVGKGEVESLQLITAASAALSRDVLSFKETGDRLRGLSAAPRLGAGALDPDLAIPGQPLQRAATGTKTPSTQVRAELRDFQSLDTASPDKWKKILLAIGGAAFLALGAHAIYFGLPRLTPVPAETAGKNVQRIDVHDQNALVIVNQEWIDNAPSESLKLLEVLRDRGVKKAMLMLANGRPAGTLDVQSGRILGLPQRATPKK